jgi:predicted DNA-binding transcriptional regulator YafY
MPKSAGQNAIVRQWELLRKLSAHGTGATAAELTQSLREDGFSATKRTVERDLALLERLFSLRCDDSAGAYRWSRIKGSAADLPAVDCADAISLTVIEEMLGNLLPPSVRRTLEPKFKQARTKLSSLADNRYARWSERVRYVPPSLPFLPPKIGAGILETVQEAVAQNRRLVVRYSNPSDARAREIVLHPLAFIQQGPVAYLVATAFDFTDPRLYAVHRLSAAKMAVETARGPAGFSLNAFLESGGMQFGEGGPVRLRAVVSNKLACYLAESPLAKDQRLAAKGKDRYLLTATIKDSWQLHFWILSQGDGIVVVKPENLRVRIRASLQAALDGYRIL